VKAYKLLNVRADGTIGPLFINRRQRIPIGEWIRAEDHPTKGYAHRPGWHTTSRPEAPHLTEEGRSWYEVEVLGVTKFDRPQSQGGTWFIAEHMKVVRAL
jgi:hypothetical protein